MVVNTLPYVYIVEELMQLKVGSDAEIITNSHWTEDPSNTLKVAASVLNSIHVSVP